MVSRAQLISWYTRLEVGLTESLAKFKQPHVRRLVLGIAVVIFAVTLFWALRDFPGNISDLRLQPILLNLFVGIPTMIALLASDFLLQARFAGARVPLSRALEVTIVGNAANMLPLPGGAAVRLAALKTYGGTLLHGAYSIALFPGLLLGVGLIYGGGWLAADFNPIQGVAFLVVGVVVLAASTAAFFLLAANPSIKLLLLVLLVKLLQVLTAAIRIEWSFETLGISVDHAQASIFVVASLIGSLVWIVPGGLGVREAVSAVLAPLVGLAPAEGFLSATVLRVVELVGVLPAALLLVSSRPRRLEPGMTEGPPS